MSTHASRVAETVIDGLGMVSSLGLDIETICAAARAGLTRASVLQNYRMRSAVDGDEEPVMGHSATLLTHGFEGQARLVRLLQGALCDLMRNAPHLDWREARFYVCLPHPRRTYRDTDLESSHWSVVDSIVERAAVLARWPAQIDVAFRSFDGNIAVLRAIGAAMADISSDQTRIAVVLAADSLLDEGTLNWLNASGRLKCDATPAGLRPGEAGGAVALRARENDFAHDAAAGILGVQFAGEKRNFLSGAAPAGEGLAQVLGGLWSANETDQPWIVCDQNGENYRASDWGFALVRLRAMHAAFSSPVLWYPAGNIGDAGVVNSIVGICFAVRAWQRGYGPARVALVSASNDDAGRGALLFENMSAS